MSVPIFELIVLISVEVDIFCIWIVFQCYNHIRTTSEVQCFVKSKNKMHKYIWAVTILNQTVLPYYLVL